MSWKRVRFGDVVTIERDGVSPEALDVAERYAGLEHIDPDGFVAGIHTVGSSQLKSTKFRFDRRHILFGKLRPYLRKIARPNFDGVCSTDILPLLPGPNICRDYLFHYLRTPEAVQFATQHSAGANLPRISPNLLAEMEIPLPSEKREQQRIAAILERADDIRRKRLQALQLADQFLRSVFVDLFGDPAANPEGWPEEPFGEIVQDSKLGLVRSAEEYGWDMPIPYVRMDALSSDGGFLAEKVQGTNASTEEIKAYALKAGDFLFNTRNSRELVGKVAVFPGPDGALFNNNLMRIRFRPGLDAYCVLYQFGFTRVQRELEARKQGTTSVFAVYWKNLATLPILIPPIKLQQRFRALVDKTLGLKNSMSDSSEAAKASFAVLQQRAFRGGL